MEDLPRPCSCWAKFRRWLTPHLVFGDLRRRVMLRLGWAFESLVGAENSVTSCDLQMLVYETSESISSQRPNGRSGWWGSAAYGRVLIE